MLISTQTARWLITCLVWRPALDIFLQDSITKRQKSLGRLYNIGQSYSGLMHVLNWSYSSYYFFSPEEIFPLAFPLGNSSAHLLVGHGTKAASPNCGPSTITPQPLWTPASPCPLLSSALPWSFQAWVSAGIMSIAGPLAAKALHGKNLLSMRQLVRHCMVIAKWTTHLPF